ncbi:MAG: hypothetical protein PHZ14_06445 [Sulfuricella sp.]|jgi:hypothetical protein|nr:hypothetical protein [Sulfuricella sp.]
MAKRIPAPPEYDRTRVIERPDGFFWQDKTSDEMYGPFPTLLDAIQDMEYNDDSDYGPGETIEEAEAELGIADWIDPDTGLPGEETHHLGD